MARESALLEEVLLLLDWDDEAAGTVCLLISLLAVTASASLRRTELELAEELDEEEVAFISLLTELEVEVFREVVPLLLDEVVVVATATFLGGRAARFSSAWGNWFKEVPDLLRSGRSGTTGGAGAAVDSLSLRDG